MAMEQIRPLDWPWQGKDRDHSSIHVDIAKSSRGENDGCPRSESPDETVVVMACGLGHITGTEPNAVFHPVSRGVRIGWIKAERDQAALG